MNFGCHCSSARCSRLSPVSPTLLGIFAPRSTLGVMVVPYPTREGGRMLFPPGRGDRNFPRPGGVEVVEPMDDSARARRRAFEALAQGLEGPLHAAALRLTRKAADAEDLVQETWVRAFRSFGQFQPGTSFKAWVFRIEMNAFLNRERRRGK